MADKQVLLILPEELLEEVDRAAKGERRQRSEFVREALKDRIARSAFKSALKRLRAETESHRSEAEVSRDIEHALAEARVYGTLSEA